MNTNHYPGETNPLEFTDEAARDAHWQRVHEARTVDWTEPGLRVTRLRLLSDPGFPAWDVSYCWGMIGDEFVEVRLPFDQLPKRGFRRAIVEYAKEDGVYARGLGILDNVSTLI